ncbi:hypothetical protein P8V03_18505 [Clostridium sp. A1-XYC3]|uniref:GAF domain-containing protein n=1 Tax=Clostridium tanneri TaxID=3037988 RepID=A0ABU4JYV7_9CLOT|nr:hypothetical protein [Clostridium sp. A1-XYC3]MDW8803123.1 hypothetical protein [Clostridium sp. A1-XYC3]
MLNAFLEDKGLQYLVDVAGGILGNFALVQDLTSRVIVYSKNMNMNNHNFLKQGRFPYHLGKLIREKNILVLFNNKSPVRVNKCEFIPYNLIAGRIDVMGKLVASVSITENEKSFEESDDYLVQLLSNLISSEIQKDRSQIRFKEAVYELFRADLPDGKFSSQSDIDERLNYLGLKLKENLFELNVKIESNPDAELLLHLCHHLESVINESKSIIYQNNIVLLINKCDKAVKILSFYNIYFSIKAQYFHIYIFLLLNSFI